MRLRLSSPAMTSQLAMIHLRVAAYALVYRAKSEVIQAVATNALRAHLQTAKRHGAICAEPERLHQLAPERAKRVWLVSTMRTLRLPHRVPCAPRENIQLCRENVMDRAKQEPTPHLGQRPAAIVKFADPEHMTAT